MVVYYKFIQEEIIKNLVMEQYPFMELVVILQVLILVCQKRMQLVSVEREQ
ncbi:hypothetical protein FD13_GL002114 [Levilactobacillus senmaizukei DSM 21775 = NBRC 103853]|uniref:Uncharacterized protein n=1 Tax=Levilactobacillus senmaizukei DSM 21775 = NBRC 103853 TaxID=1423803 RepID=A0A0R2DE39_9LACO|nr:hypothetical protein FD13_GL002114 [Levilactobacillus senmaizukei DSM 21775 = NBRC 103853]